MMRDIVVIDDEKCDGCGDCVPACAEGALRIEGGKARLVADALCDGMAACIGHCPKGAIRIERREAAAFDDALVAERRALDGDARPFGARLPPESARAQPAQPTGCPGSRAQSLRGLRVLPPDAHAARPAPVSASGRTPDAASALATWPVKLRLLSPGAPFLRGADLLIAADCVPAAAGDFHARRLPGRVLALACPKFEEYDEVLERLQAIVAEGGVASVTVLRMVVPCCGGIVAAVRAACARAGFSGPLTETVLGLTGEELSSSTSLAQRSSVVAQR